MPRFYPTAVELQFDKCFDEDTERYRSPFVYRGLSNEDYELKTSLMRLGGKFYDLEKPLLRNFRKYAEGSVNLDGSIWKLLSIAQHHGLPTRLLDWTFSPYVALHFTTANRERYDTDGVVWCVNFRSLIDILPGELREELHREKANGFSVEMLGKVCPTLEDFDKLKENSEFVAFFEPPSIDARIINQFAFFSVMSNPRTGLNDWLRRHPKLFYRIVIPKELKWEIRDKLDQANITERVMFPGLDGLCQWLGRWYSSKELL